MQLRPHFLFVLDAQGRLGSSNFLHPEYTPESVYGRRFVEFLEPRCRDCVEEVLSGALQGETGACCPIWRSPERPMALHVTLAQVKCGGETLVLGAALALPPSWCAKRVICSSESESSSDGSA